VAGRKNGDEHVEHGEPRVKQLDKHWGELLQELRVVQTGVQLLTGFLLTLPFQQRFVQLGSGQRHLYLLVVSLSVGATTLLVAPVTAHRVLFRHHERPWLILIGHWCAAAGCALLGLALSGVAALVFDVVSGGSAAEVAAGAALGGLVGLWLLLPLGLRLVPAPALDEDPD
jgi:hypothetical protein